MPNFLKQYSAVQEYMESVNKARENLEKMQTIVVKQFRHQHLFSKIQDIGCAYIPAGLEYRESSINYAYDWLQIVHPTREAVHLEWLLENNGQPGFKCVPGENIPFYFHIEMKEKRMDLVSYILDYIAHHNNGEFYEDKYAFWWKNEKWDFAILKTYQKGGGGMLRVMALQEIDAQKIEQWLPELLQTPPVQLLLKLLTDETFWKRSEIKQLID